MAAGDGVISPVKFGGLATHQARCAIAAIARLAGVTEVPDPGEPVLHGHLLVGGRSRRLEARGDAAGAPLWWPTGKVAGEYLPRWLAEHGLAPQAVEGTAPAGNHGAATAARDGRRRPSTCTTSRASSAQRLRPDEAAPCLHTS